MDIETYTADLRERLQTTRATTAELAALAGGVISASWINQFRAGHKNNPTVASLIALERALAASGDGKQQANAA